MDGPAGRGQKPCILCAERPWPDAPKAATRSLRQSKHGAQARSRCSLFQNRGFWPRIDHSLPVVYCISEVDSNPIRGGSGSQKVTFFPARKGIACGLGNFERFGGSREQARQSARRRLDRRSPQTVRPDMQRCQAVIRLARAPKGNFPRAAGLPGLLETDARSDAPVRSSEMRPESSPPYP